MERKEDDGSAEHWIVGGAEAGTRSWARRQHLTFTMPLMLPEILSQLCMYRIFLAHLKTICSK